MDDFDGYKRAMLVIKPVDAMEAFISFFNKGLSHKFSRGLTSLATRKSKSTYRNEADKITVTKDNFGNVPVTYYQPDNDNNGGVVYVHGGFWLIYDAEDYDQLMYDLAKKTKLFVAVVDYKRSPEHKFPEALNEICDATKYLIENASRFKIDSKRIAIAGDSTGGNMAAAAVNKLRTENVDIKCSCLVNAPLQFFDFTLPSYQQNEAANHLNILTYSGLCTRVLNEYVGVKIPPQALANNMHTSAKLKEAIAQKKFLSWENLPEKYRAAYTPKNESVEKSAVPDDSSLFHENVSPLLADDETLKLNPRTHIITSEYDVFRDDGFLYEARLRKLGVNATITNFEKGYHGALNLYQNNDFKLPKRVFEELARFLIENL